VRGCQGRQGVFVSGCLCSGGYPSRSSNSAMSSSNGCITTYRVVGRCWRHCIERWGSLHRLRRRIVLRRAILLESVAGLLRTTRQRLLLLESRIDIVCSARWRVAHGASHGPQRRGDENWRRKVGGQQTPLSDVQGRSLVDYELRRPHSHRIIVDGLASLAQIFSGGRPPAQGAAQTCKKATGCVTELLIRCREGNSELRGQSEVQIQPPARDASGLHGGKP
jgi:hypothetical protein